MGKLRDLRRLEELIEREQAINIKIHSGEAEESDYALLRHYERQRQEKYRLFEARYYGSNNTKK